MALCGCGNIADVRATETGRLYCASCAVKNIPDAARKAGHIAKVAGELFNRQFTAADVLEALAGVPDPARDLEDERARPGAGRYGL